MKTSRFRSINFILWISFIGFAAFILGITWVFQTTLLKDFYAEQIKKDLWNIGDGAYVYLCKAIDGQSATKEEFSEQMNGWIMQQERNNRSASVYLLDKTGKSLIDENPIYASDNYVADEHAKAYYSTGVTKLLNSDKTKDVYKANTACYVYLAQLDMSNISEMPDEAYLYISYSTEISAKAFADMRLNLVVVAVVVIFVALFISALLSMELTKPIAKITKAAKRMAKGDFSIDFTGKYAYAEINALAESLNYAKEEIGKSDELQKEVLASITHDLKTPLTMIKAYASMIQEISGDNPEKRTKHTQVIIEESDRLTSLVNDILNLSKIRSGMDTLKTQLINLSEIIHTVLERFEFLELQGYTFERNIEDDLFVEADVEKLEQVVYNLIGNAINYTGDDKKIKVGLCRDGCGHIRFTVTDTGKGIPPEEISTIWDRYYRSSQTHKRPIKGTGLGLSIVKTILIKHGFEYGVESEVGKGSTFYVVFPEK